MYGGPERPFHLAFCKLAFSQIHGLLIIFHIFKLVFCQFLHFCKPGFFLQTRLFFNNIRALL